MTSRRGRYPDPRAEPDIGDSGEPEALEGAATVEVVCGHGVADGEDTPRALRPRRIATFLRMDVGERWDPHRPSRAAQQGPPSGRRPGLWRLACPVCDRPREMADRRLQARLSALADAGVSLVDLRALSL